MDAVFFSMPCIRRKPQAAGEKAEKRELPHQSSSLWKKFNRKCSRVFTGNILVGCCFQHMKFPVSFVGNEEENQSSSFVQIRSVSRRLRRVHQQLQCPGLSGHRGFYLLLQSFWLFLPHIVSERAHQFPDLLHR